ncbi:putative Heterokaryon incompatibility protein [Seiridium cardinale]
MLYAQPQSIAPTATEDDKEHHPNLLSLQKAWDWGCSICLLVTENARLDDLRQRKKKWGSNVDDLIGPNTFLSIGFYYEEFILKIDITLWTYRFSSVTRFRLLPESGKHTIIQQTHRSNILYIFWPS